MIYLDNNTKEQRIYIPREVSVTGATGETVVLQHKNYNLTENGRTQIIPDAGYAGISGGSITVNVDTRDVFASGYTSGVTDGMTEQKSLLSSTTISDNGPYTSENGWSAVTVDVPQTGYTQSDLDNAYASGQTNGAASQKALLTSRTINDNGTYTSENGFSAVTVNVSSGGGGENRLNALLRKTITAITSSDLDNVQVVNYYTFANNPRLVSCASFKTDATGQIYLYDYAFQNCTSLNGITFDTTASQFNPLVSIGQRTFSGCTSLSDIETEKITIVSTESFGDCYALSGNIKLGVNTITGSRVFKNCTGITSFTFVKHITQVYGTNYFEGCTNVQYIDLTHNTSVPSLSNVSIFSPFQSNYQIRVPQSLYNEWTATTNWSTIASHIVGV